MGLTVPWSMPDIGVEEKSAVQRVLDSGWVSLGEETAAFERELAQYLGCRDVVVFNSGTSALVAELISKEAYDWRKVKHLPTYTFPSTLNAILAAGGGQYQDFGISDIQYMPLNSTTMTAFTPFTSTLKMGDIYIPVSFAGLPLNKDNWGEYADLMVEDAAESFGAKSHGLRTGNQGWDAIFSFHVAKLITMIEGGAVSTDSTMNAEKLRCIRSYGESRDEKGVFSVRGLNMKPSDIHSAIGREQLKKASTYLRQRKKVSTVYREQLCGLVGFQHIPEHVEVHGNMMFPILVEDPVRLSAKLSEKGISTRLGWGPLTPDPQAQHIYEHIICLPIFNTMSEDAAEYVASMVMEELV